MEQEFRRSTGYKIFYYVIVILMVGFSLFLFCSPSLFRGVLAIPFIFLLLAVFIIIAQIKKKLVISADRIISTNVFGPREILISKVKGYRITPKSIIIEPKTSGNEIVVINNYSDLGNNRIITKWLKDNLGNLNEGNLKQEQEILANNIRLGSTEDERDKKLQIARYIAITYNVLGSIGSVLFIVSFNKFIVLFPLIYPISGIMIMVFSKGLIKFVSHNERSFYRFIMFGFMIPAFTMCAIFFGYYHIYQFKNILIPLIIIESLLFWLLYSTGINKSLSKARQIIVMFLISLIYACGSIMAINCSFDQSKPQIIHTVIENADITYGKKMYYTLYLKPWKRRDVPGKVNVSSDDYDRHPVGSSITVNLKHGVFNIPWYYLSK